jgi:hypothetical protein
VASKRAFGESGGEGGEREAVGGSNPWHLDMEWTEPGQRKTSRDPEDAESRDIVSLVWRA